MQTKIQHAKGILNPRAARHKFELARYAPSADIGFFVERYWIIRWDLRGQPPYTQETLPYPCVNLVFEADNTYIWGVDTGKFARVLEGRGRVFGIKFRPGGFYPFLNAPVSSFSDSTLEFADVFGMDCQSLEQAILPLDDDSAAVAIAEQFLRQHLPAPDDTITLVNDIIDCIIADRTITRVDDIVRQMHITKRTLQRLFNHYVGVSPKWVIQRYRLHEAAEQLEQNPQVDLTKLAQSLGYFDQAHFINDFKSVVGLPPAEYARRSASEA